MLEADRQRLLVWSGLDAPRWEVATISLYEQGVAARGTQVGTQPMRYRLDYDLDAPQDFVTRRLEARAHGEGWSRRLLLCNEGKGGWTCEVEASGSVDLDAPGAEDQTLEELGAARDCDLGYSPVTNFMPIRRHRLHLENGAADILVAWVSVPDLKIHSYAQRYESIERTANSSVVRFIDRGLSDGFVADLQLDADGLIQIYPELATRVG